jgi:syringate O-demethylase/vanillate/3-O-methylgallate O-demethylase
MPAIYSGNHMKPYREWLSATSWEANASLGGSFVSDRVDDYYSTPWDLGYGRLVKFDHDFIGRAALERLADGPHRKKVWAVWNDDDARRVIGDSFFGHDHRTKSLELPMAVYCTLPFDRIEIGDDLAGLAAYTGYTSNIGHVVSLAMVDEAHARDGAEVTVVWGEENGGTSKPTVERHVQTTVRAVVSTVPPLP